VTFEQAGLILIAVLLLYVVGSIIILTVWSMKSYPTIGRVKEIIGEERVTPSERAKILVDLRTEWRTTAGVRSVDPL
jgi:hypothetical protein